MSTTTTLKDIRIYLISPIENNHRASSLQTIITLIKEATVSKRNRAGGDLAGFQLGFGSLIRPKQVSEK
jgi:hypothetical protein